MNQYTIYCTEAQTRKALELGAPLFRLDGTACSDYINMVIISDTEAYTIPTAEEMIGWLEEQEGIKEFFIYLISSTWHYVIIKSNETVIERNDSYPSRKEATLAAIDAVLEYLIENKEE